MGIKELERIVFNNSICYEKSTAFQMALTFVEKNDSELYEKLLKTEVSEMGYEED